MVIAKWLNIIVLILKYCNSEKFPDFFDEYLFDTMGIKTTTGRTKLDDKLIDFDLMLGKNENTPPPPESFFPHGSPPPPRVSNENDEILTPDDIADVKERRRPRPEIHPPQILSRRVREVIAEEDRIFPVDDGQYHDAQADLDALPERLTLTNKWDEYKFLVKHEQNKYPKGQIMPNWEKDIERWAGYSRQLLVRDAIKKGKEEEQKIQPATPLPYKPSVGMGAYWSGDDLFNGGSPDVGTDLGLSRRFNGLDIIGTPPPPIEPEDPTDSKAFEPEELTNSSTLIQSRKLGFSPGAMPGGPGGMPGGFGGMPGGPQDYGGREPPHYGGPPGRGGSPQYGGEGPPNYGGVGPSQYGGPPGRGSPQYGSPSGGGGPPQYGGPPGRGPPQYGGPPGGGPPQYGGSPGGGPPQYGGPPGRGPPQYGGSPSQYGGGSPPNYGGPPSRGPPQYGGPPGRGRPYAQPMMPPPRLSPAKAPRPDDNNNISPGEIKLAGPEALRAGGGSGFPGGHPGGGFSGGLPGGGSGGPGYPGQPGGPGHLGGRKGPGNTLAEVADLEAQGMKLVPKDEGTIKQGGGAPSSPPSHDNPSAIMPANPLSRVLPEPQGLPEREPVLERLQSMQGKGAHSGKELLNMVKKKIAMYGKLEAARDKYERMHTTRRPDLKTQLLALPRADDFGAPIKWVKFNSNETIDGLAKLTDPKNMKNQQHIVEGSIYVPIVDHSLLRLGWTTEAPPEVLSTTEVQSGPSTFSPYQDSLKVMLRSMNMSLTNEQDWLALETVMTNKRYVGECTGEACQARCHKMNCESMCDGDTCSSGCVGVSCSSFCTGPGCLSMCIGDYCTAKCEGENCDARCWGKGCETGCKKFSCQSSKNGEFKKNQMTWDQAYPQYQQGFPGGPDGPNNLHGPPLPPAGYPGLEGGSYPQGPQPGTPSPGRQGPIRPGYGSLRAGPPPGPPSYGGPSQYGGPPGLQTPPQYGGPPSPLGAQQFGGTPRPQGGPDKPPEDGDYYGG